MPTISIFGQEEECPAWANYLAFDANGEGYFYKHKPMLDMGEKRWYPAVEAQPVHDWRYIFVKKPAKYDWTQLYRVAYDADDNPTMVKDTGKKANRQQEEIKIKAYDTTLLVPRFARFLAKDIQGDIFAYKSKPILHGDDWIPDNRDTVLDIRWIEADEESKAQLNHDQLYIIKNRRLEEYHA